MFIVSITIKIWNTINLLRGMYVKATGIVRKTDQLGRIVIPRELRKMLEIDQKDPLEIFVDGDQIILQKYTSSLECMVTGEVSSSNHVLANGKIILSDEGINLLLSEIDTLKVNNNR